MKAPFWMPEKFRQTANAEHRRLCLDWYAKGALSVTEALRGGIEDETEPPSITALLEFCRIIEDKAKEPEP